MLVVLYWKLAVIRNLGYVLLLFHALLPTSPLSLPSLPTVSFLRSGTKLIFRRRPRQKEAGLSQSHDDLSNTATTPSVRKKAGSFSRRLIKRFSFKSKPKANGNPSPQL